MKWLELHIDTTHAGLDTVVAMLSALDIDGVVIDDETEFQDFLENNHQYWDYVDEELMESKRGICRITFYVSADDEGMDTVKKVYAALGELKLQRDDCGSLAITTAQMDDADWENNWKQFYKPMEIGERLIVVPEWERMSTRY